MMFHSEELLSNGKSRSVTDAYRLNLVEFSATPFGRYRADGTESGQVFREDILEPALQEHDRVILNVDGVAGLPSSFWEETMGGLVRDGWNAADVRAKLDIVGTNAELQVYVRLGWRYLDEAQQKAKKPA
jgi:hypothetical protein